MNSAYSSGEFDFQLLRRQVALNQILWSVGYTFTSGAFLTWFLFDQGADSSHISWILALPELVATLSVLTRNFLRPGFQLKRSWQTFLWISRLIALGIPLCCLWSHNFYSTHHMLGVVILVLACAELLQAFSYISYLSWLSDLAPEQKWGNLFAWRNVANLLVILILPVCLGALRDWVKANWEPQQITWFYSCAFMLGCTIQLGSWWPLRKLPESTFFPHANRLSFKYLWQTLRTDISLRWLLLHQWTLSFANGLTQAVFFSLMKNELQIGLKDYFLLVGLMNLIKIPISLLAGKWCDQKREKSIRTVSLLVASSGLWFFLLATPDNWGWLWGVYLCWGAYAAANLSGFNLLLKVSPLSDNTTQIALFRRIGGLLAGLSGLLGGYWLDSLLDQQFYFRFFDLDLGSWHLIILISLAGRYLSLLFLIPVKVIR